jgi:predicted permease
MRSFLNLRAVEPGFDPERVLSFALALPVARYPSGDELRAFYAHLEEGLAAVPGVTEVGVVSTLFLSDLPNMGGVSVEARPEAYEQATEFPVVRDAASTGFFGAAGMEIVAGRAVDGTDVSGGTSVAVVNEAFARIHLAGLDPIGQRFMWGVPSGEDPAWVTVVGVVEDARRSGLDRPVRPSAFVPTTQAPERRTDVLVKTSVDPMVVAEAVRDVVEDLDARLPVTRVRTLEQAMSDSLAGRRFVAWLLGLFAVSALALAAVGIFGVMAYVVAQRTREIGIRVALGAERSSVLARTLGEGMLQAGIGLVMGAAASLGLTGVVRGQLYGIEPTDATTFALASAMLIGTAAVACLVPALRAAAVDPVVALRED